MANVFDVAAYILAKRGPMSAMKLQKLAYYAQAWSLVWDEKPLFDEPIEAWANGPVVRALYEKHRGIYIVENISDGDPGRLSGEQIETIDAILEYYGDKSAQWLSDLSHEERPWKKARTGLADADRSSVIISHAAMHEYYSSLQPQNVETQYPPVAH